jgi:uncharacterized protein (DUF1499 family)
MRRSPPNLSERGGLDGYDAAQTAEKQAYPDIALVTLALPPAQAFERALAAARAAGWIVLASDPTSGRIEATQQTHWFGFTDDIVVRVSPEGESSRIDVRSASRVGRHDLGANAKRIRDYLARLKAAN